MNQDLQIKQAHLNELPDALALFKSASKVLGKKNLKQWNYWADPPIDKIDWVQEGFNKGEFFFVYGDSEEKIAMFRLLKTDTLYWDEKGLEENVRYVHSLVVAHKYAGKGIGKLVLNNIIDSLNAIGVSKFRLDCDASNQKLCNYYEAFGFKKVGAVSTHYSSNNLYEMSLVNK